MAKEFEVDTGGTLTTSLQAYYKAEDVTEYYTGGGTLDLTNNNTVAFNAAKIDNGADGGTTNTNKSLSIANNLGIDGGACSISFWVKINTEVAAGTYGLVCCASSGTDVLYFVRYDYNAGTRRLRFFRVKQNVAVTASAYTVTLVTTNWYHVVLTYDTTNIKGYVNNIQQGADTAASGTGSGQTSAFIILGDNSGDGSTIANFASAIVDEVGIWSKALSTNEITDLYNSGNGQTMVEVSTFKPQVIII